MTTSVHITRFAWVFFITLCVPALSQAQDARPAIEIDTTILEELNRYYGSEEEARPPAPLSQPKIVPAPVPELHQAPAPRTETSFPVKTTTRHKTLYSEQLSPQIRAQLIQPPVPSMKPVRESMADVVESQAPLVTPPLPPRRPLIQRASKAFVQKARRHMQHKDDAGPVMPAVPAEVVEAQALIPPQQMERHIDITAPAFPAENQPAQAVAKTVAVKKAGRVAQAAAPAPKPDSQQVPRPPEDQQDGFAFVSLDFTTTKDSLTADHITVLERDVLPILFQNGQWRLQIQAFATPIDSGISSARRASLSRALSVRNFLISQGMNSERMDVRALGTQTDREPQDRVDLVFLPPTVN